LFDKKEKEKKTRTDRASFTPSLILLVVVVVAASHLISSLVQTSSINQSINRQVLVIQPTLNVSEKILVSIH